MWVWPCFSGLLAHVSYVQDVTRPRYSILRAFKPDFTSDAWSLVDTIAKYST